MLLQFMKLLSKEIETITYIILKALRHCEYDSKAYCEIEKPPTFQHCCRRNLRPPNQTRSQTRVKNLVIQDASYKQFKEHDNQSFIIKKSCTNLLTY